MNISFEEIIKMVEKKLATLILVPIQQPQRQLVIVSSQSEIKIQLIKIEE